MLNVAAGAFAVGIEKTAAWEVHLLHLSQAAGTSVETMSGLSFAAKMMSLDIDQVAKAMERFDKQVASARAGNLKAQQNMSILGVDVSTLKTSDEALMKLADQIAAMPQEMARTAAAAAAFGVKLGPSMIPLLALGSKGIQDFMDEAKAMGVVITKDQAEQAETFEQNVTRMKESLHGLWVEITNKTLPVLNDLTTQFLKTEQTKGFWHGIGELTAAMANGASGMSAYMMEGNLLILQQDKLRTKVKAVADGLNDSAKAFEALKKSVAAINTSLITQMDTLGMSAMAVQSYKIKMDAAAVGQKAWGVAMAATYEWLQKSLNLWQQLALIDNQTKDEQKKNFLAAKLKADQDILAAMAAQLDVATRLSVVPPPALLLSGGPNDRFTASLNEQIDALKYAAATFGMTSDQIAIFNLRQLDGSAAARAMIPALEAEQIKLKGMRDVANAAAEAAKRNQAAWREFTSVADRGLNDLIFSGKKFSDVLLDVAKSLGELFLKWALFGFGNKSGGGIGGIFGSLFGALFGGGGLGALFGGLSPLPMGSFTPFAAGGPVSAGVPIMVGENGPEIFMPSTAGAIIPNGSGAGESNVTINYVIDARGSSITEEQFRRSLAESEGRAVHRALLATREAQFRTA